MMRFLTANELDEMSYAPEYSDYIMANCGGDRVICNGDTLIGAMEDGYLFEEFLASIDCSGEEA